MIDKEYYLQIWIFQFTLHVGGSFLKHKIAVRLAMDGKKVRSWKRRIRNAQRN